jgi:hypothetical protein
MHNRKLSVRQAYFLGQLIVNGGVILVMVVVWILSFIIVAKAHLSVWLVLPGIFAGPLVAWIWWAFSTPRWRDFASQYLDEAEMQQLHQAAIQGQLEWPQGHVFSRTEITSRKQKLKEAETAKD